MADVVFYDFVGAMASGNLDFVADTLKCALVTSSYTPDTDHRLWATASGYEVANGNGYTTGGVSVAGTVTQNTGLNKAVFDIADPTWTAASGAIGPFRYGILYDSTQAAKPLIYCFDFSTDQTASSGASITIQINTSGLLTIGE